MAPSRACSRSRGSASPATASCAKAISAGKIQGEVKHHLGVVGQLLQNRAAERPANKVDAGIQVFMRNTRDAADGVSGRQ